MSENWPLISDELRFREWVRDAPRSPVLALKEDLQALYTHYGVSRESEKYPLQNVENYLNELIKKAFPEGSDIGTNEVSRLQRQMVFRHFLDGEDLHPVFDVVEVMRNAMRSLPGQRFAGFNAAVEWREVVLRCLDCLALRSPAEQQVDEEMFRSIHLRSVNVAESAGRLRKRGMKLTVESGRIVPAVGEMERVGARLYSTVQKLGGAEVVMRLLSSMEPMFDSSMGRYHLVRAVSVMPELVDSQIPFGYLLNLGVRELHGVPNQRSNLDSVQGRWEELVSEAKDLTAILDVQPYSIYESMFMGPEQLIGNLQEAALYDSVFTLVQLRPSDVTPLLKGLFEWVDEKEMRSRLGWTLSGALEVTEYIISSAASPKGCRFRVSDVASKLGRRTKGELRKILLALSHEHGRVNEGYTLPTHGERITFGFKPLIRLNDDSYVLVSPSWCGPAFYEAVAAALRSAGFDDVQQRVGFATEFFVRDRLTKHGVLSVSGDYTDSKKGKGECDAVVESTETVIFIEMKGKALTRASRSGTAVNLMLDIAASFLKAQAQAGGHEHRIGRDGHLQLSHKKEGDYRLELQGRTVERVALTLLEYGAFQDRFFCQRILGAVVDAVVRVDDKKWEEKLRQFFESQSDLRAQLQAQIKLEGRGFGPNPFMNVVFLSVPQILVLLDGVDSPDSFRAALWLNRHTSFSSRDFYFEVSQMRRLKALAPSAK